MAVLRGAAAARGELPSEGDLCGSDARTGTRSRRGALGLARVVMGQAQLRTGEAERHDGSADARGESDDDPLRSE
jgi:hypothetical protein